MNRALTFRAAFLGFLSMPVRDLLNGLDRLIERGGARALALVGVGLVVGWWIYVPAHELLHAAACVAAGGEVTRLEIAPLYGGALLGRVFPFVVAGGEYAGRLSGFDTRGSDWVYLATDFGPYLLTLWPGVWALRRAARRGRPLGFGMAVPVALAPFVSLTGDAYEIGSIVASRGLGSLVAVPAAGLAAVRGDDLFRVLAAVNAQQTPGLWFLVAAAVILAVLWAGATYGLASTVALWLGEPPPSSAPRRAGTAETGSRAGPAGN